MGQARKAPLHVPIAIGVTTGLYAVSLAGVTALQAGTDAGITTAHRPASEALAEVTARRTSLERDLAAAAGSLNQAGDAYNAALARATAFHQVLSELAREVTGVTGAVASVPSRLSLPTAARRVSTTTSAPPVQATTGASGKP